MRYANLLNLSRIKGRSRSQHLRSVRFSREKNTFSDRIRKYFLCLNYNLFDFFDFKFDRSSYLKIIYVIIAELVVIKQYTKKEMIFHYFVQIF